MKKRLFLVTNLDQGGLETYLLRYLQYDREAYNVVICKSGKVGSLHSEYKNYVSAIYTCKLGYINVKDMFSYYKLLNSDFDVICDFTGNFAGVPLLIAKIVGIKKRIAFYRGSTNHFKETFLRLLYNNLVKRLVQYSSTKILSNSYAALDFFFPKRSKMSKKYKVIYNGINLNDISHETKEKLRKEFNIPLNAFVIGHTGRCNFAKNHDTILSVAIELCHKNLSVQFVLVGKGVKEKYYTRVKQEGLENRIHFLGYRNDVMRILPLFDLYYFPSLTEGQPNALIEAMVTGLPVLASSIKPIKETMPRELHSFLLDPTDIKEAVRVIDSICKQDIDINQYSCKEWALNHFDAKILFEEFKKEL